MTTTPSFHWDQPNSYHECCSQSPSRPVGSLHRLPPTMLLGPISFLDCLAFILFLVPQLLIQISLLDLIRLASHVVPFLVLRLPYNILVERYFTLHHNRPPFCQSATLFQDVVVRCVRYAFANIDASIGRIFFCKPVALQFFMWRLLRHGYLSPPVRYTELQRGEFQGLWITDDDDDKEGAVGEPDVIIYYAHGGGFSMGSSYFYLEFLVAWLHCLRQVGFRSPAILALEYSLVPNARWPTQLEQTKSAYRFLLNAFGENVASRIVVSGDSAGATLVLSMLLQNQREATVAGLPKPALGVLLSPWAHLVSERNRNTASDYLDKDSLERYALQYAGHKAKDNAVVSPGLSIGRWMKASPVEGFGILYGAEEVFGPGIVDLVAGMNEEGVEIVENVKEKGIHAWPVVDLFLGDDEKTRLRGLRVMTDMVRRSRIGKTLDGHEPRARAESSD